MLGRHLLCWNDAMSEWWVCLGVRRTGEHGECLRMQKGETIVPGEFAKQSEHWK